MKFTADEALYYTGVEDRSFQDRENGRQVNYYAYNFLTDDEEGKAMHFGSDNPLLTKDMKKFDLCYPCIEVSFNRNGAARIKLTGFAEWANDGNMEQ